MERFVISDLHLGHNGIVGYRNMQTLAEHDEKIMERATRLIYLRDGKVEQDERK